MKVKVSVSPFFFSLIVKCNCTFYSLKDNHRLYCFCFVFFLILFFLLPNGVQKIVVVLDFNSSFVCT